MAREMAIKNFILDTLITLILIILMIIGVEFSATQANNNYSYKSQYLQHHAKEIKILALGSSLTYNDINPHILGSGVFNAGLPGKNIYYDVQLLEKHIDRMDSLHTVLYPIHCDMMIMRDYGAKSPRNYMAHTFMGLEHPNERKRIYTKSLFLTGSLNIGIFRTEVMQMGCDSLGYGGISGAAKWRPAYKSHHEPNKPEEFTHYLAQLAKICNEHGVRLLTFTCPAHEYEFDSPDAPLICSQAIEKSIQSVRQQYPIEYKDYMSDPRLQSDSLYYDWAHLNRDGAKIFTQQIKDAFGL